jgi:hypothetical protein
MAQPRPRSSPYQGLIPYTEQDANYFFGREKETRLIVANLFASPLTLLYGPSGVGKSSVLRAGVVNELSRRQHLAVVVQSNWKSSPLARLKTRVGTRAGLGENFETQLVLGDFLQQVAVQNNIRFMIILDQFEDYFLYHPLKDEFTVQFSQAVMYPGLPASFLVSVREDSLAKLDRFEGRIPILFDNYLRLDHLDDDAARNAIEKPVEQYNRLYAAEKSPVHIERELVDEVLHQLKTGRVSLNRIDFAKTGLDGKSGGIETPYLQLVMTRLWAQEMTTQSSTLRLATLKNLGGAETIVRTHLDSVMNRLSSDHQLLASRVFQYLVTPSGTKIALSASDLASFVEAPAPVVRSLLQRLSDQDVRLLRAVETNEKAGVSYEIFHDVLASPILDWRERWLAWYNLKRRGLTFVLVLIFVIAITLVLRSFLVQGSDLSLIYSCIIPVLILTFIFGVIGFLVGINWARTK